MSLFNLLLDACRKVARGIRALFRSCLSCFGFCCHDDGDFVGDVRTYSYDALSDYYHEQEKSLPETGLSALKRVAQAGKSCLYELFGPCFPYCMRHPSWVGDDDDLDSVTSDISVSSFRKMHAAYSPVGKTMSKARKAMWYLAPEDPEAAKLLEEEACTQSSSDSSSDEEEYITTEPRTTTNVVVAEVHCVQTAAGGGRNVGL